MVSPTAPSLCTQIITAREAKNSDAHFMNNTFHVMQEVHEKKNASRTKRLQLAEMVKTAVAAVEDGMKGNRRTVANARKTRMENELFGAITNNDDRGTKHTGGNRSHGRLRIVDSSRGTNALQR